MIERTRSRQWKTKRLHADRATPGIPRAIVLHTAEGAPTWTARRLGLFIENREDPGSYHLGADASGGLEQYIHFDWEAFHVAPRNGNLRPNAMSFGLAWTFASVDWKLLSNEELGATLDAGARGVFQVNAWMEENLGESFNPRMLTLEQFWAGESGFIRHADLDPERRSDPGDYFPEANFLIRCKAILQLSTTEVLKNYRRNNQGATGMDDREMQDLLKKAGYQLAVDGKRGPETNRVLRQGLEDLKILGDLKAFFNR